jgi:hypothetical protein
VSANHLCGIIPPKILGKCDWSTRVSERANIWIFGLNPAHARMYGSYYTPHRYGVNYFEQCTDPELLTFIGFDALTAVLMKNNIFCDITPCSPLKVNRCFGGTYRLKSKVITENTHFRIALYLKGTRKE